MNVGAIYSLQSHYELALENYFNSLRIVDKLNDTILKAGLLANIGAIYLDQLNYDKALDYYFQGNDLYRSVNNKRGIADTYRNIGNVYEQTNRIDSSYSVYQNAFTIYNELGDLRGMVAINNRFGELALKKYEREPLKKYLKESKQYYENSISLNQNNLDDTEELCSSLQGMANVSLFRGNYNKAEKDFKKGVAICHRRWVYHRSHDYL
jgi:tetratricopeptide (TPR) repeat protein